MATVAMPVAAKGKRDVCGGDATVPGSGKLRKQLWSGHSIQCPVTIGAGDTTVVVAAADP